MAQQYPEQPKEPVFERPQEPVFERPVPVQTDEARRNEQKATSAPWIGGAILVLLGLIFLLRNFGIFDLRNWWALFILIPAVGSFGTAWSIYQNNGNRMSDAVRGPLIGGTILTLVAAAFLFNLNWGLLWPVILIIVGIGALIGGLGRR